MNRNDTPLTSRRQFLKATGGLAAMSALSGVRVPTVHAAGSDEIQVALVGCGGRGSGAAIDALGTSKLGPIKLVAMADAYEDRLKSSYEGLSQEGGKQIDVPAERRVLLDDRRHLRDALAGPTLRFVTPPVALE